MTNHSSRAVSAAPVAVDPAHPSRKLLDFSAVLARVPVSRSRIYQLIATGQFPRQIKIGARSAWIEAEIDRWVDGLAARRSA